MVKSHLQETASYFDLLKQVWTFYVTTQHRELFKRSIYKLKRFTAIA